MVTLRLIEWLWRACPLPAAPGTRLWVDGWAQLPSTRLASGLSHLFCSHPWLAAIFSPLGELVTCLLCSAHPSYSLLPRLAIGLSLGTISSLRLKLWRVFLRVVHLHLPNHNVSPGIAEVWVRFRSFVNPRNRRSVGSIPFICQSPYPTHDIGAMTRILYKMCTVCYWPIPMVMYII